MNLDEYLKNYNVNENVGLDEKSIIENREKYGVNELKEGKKTPNIIKFLNQFKDALIIILIIAAVLSIIIDRKEWIESLIIGIVVILNAFLGFFQENKAEKSLEALKKMSQPISKALRDSKIVEISSKDIVCGDIILVEAGDFIPADARIISSYELKVDESSLTGESVPVLKTNEEIVSDNVSLGDMKNMLFSSTYVTNGKAKAVVINVGMNTEIGKIADMLENSKEENTPLQNKLNQVGKIIGIMCLIICFIVFIFEVISGYIHQNGVNSVDIWLNSFKSAIALAVAAIPEGLAAVVTIVLSIGVQKMVKKNAIVKRLPAVETLGSTSVICSDKTGTLTQNKMKVVKIYQSEIKGFDRLTNSEIDLIKYFAICCDAKIEDDGKRLGDPTELALIDLNNSYGESIKNTYVLYELPFDSDRKMMTTVIKDNDCYLAITKGAPDIIINNCIDEKEILNDALNANEALSNDALRVLALGIKKFDHMPNKLNLEHDLTFFGLVGMIDPARPEVKESIRISKDANIKVIMITGDHINTAKAIATDLGILESGKKAITSKELALISDEELFDTIDDYRVFARVAPKDKVRIVETWQKNNQVVAMTGDGVNDAPALKKSDIGCAMGITGTDVSKQAADLILTDDNFATIVEAVKQGRGIYSNIKKCVRFLLSSNIGEVITIFLVSLFGIFVPNLGVPLLAMHLLWINLITDSLPAFGLGMEETEESVMKELPRDKSQGFFSNHLGVTIFIEGIYIGLITICAYFIGHFMFSDDNLAHTMAFMTLATTELFHAYNVKQNNSIFNKNTFKNKFLNISFIIGFSLQLGVLYIPKINELFKLKPLNLIQFIICISLSLSVIIFSELYKIFKRKN